MKKKQKDYIIKEVARDLHVKKEFVREIFDRIVDVVAEQALEEGQVHIHGLVSIYAGNHAGMGRETETLKASVSVPLRKLFIEKNKNKDLVVDRNNWRSEAYNVLKKWRKTPSKASVQKQDKVPYFDPLAGFFDEEEW